MVSVVVMAGVGIRVGVRVRVHTVASTKARSSASCFDVRVTRLGGLSAGSTGTVLAMGVSV